MAKIKQGAASETALPTAPITASAPAPRPGAAPSVAVMPEVATERNAAPLPVLPARPAFVFAWHPAAWMVHAGRLVPSLRQVRLQPGVSNVGKTRDGRIAFAGAKARLEERGWSVLPHALGPGGSYMRAVKTDPSGQGRQVSTCHITAWETAYSGSARIESDEAGYAAWLESLVADGHIPPCPPHIAERLREHASGRLERLEDKVQRGVTAAAPAAKAARGEVAVLVEAIDALRTPEADASPAVPELDA